MRLAFTNGKSPTEIKDGEISSGHPKAATAGPKCFTTTASLMSWKTAGFVQELYSSK